MNKSRLSLFIIAALFMMSLLVFEASALTAYGQPCTANSECTSRICDYIWEASDGRKECKCAINSDCPDGQGCEASTKMCKKAYGVSCTAPTQCASGVCGNSLSSGMCGCSSDANCLSTQLSCVTSTHDCKIKNGAACSPGSPQLCVSGYCNPSTRLCGARLLAADSNTELQAMPYSGGSAATQCSSGFLCVSGRCNANLEVNAACTKPEQCKSGICTSISGSKKCFNVCSSWADCAGGKICDTKTGACVQAASKIIGADCLVQNEVCTSHSCGTDGKCKRCGSASDCVVPGRTTQVGMMCTAGVCQPLREDRQDCMSPTECKSGMCLGTGASRKCGTLCTKNTDCAYLRKICDLTAGACITPKTKATDAACFQNEACQSGLCYNGKCIASCGTATPPPSGGGDSGTAATQCSSGFLCVSGRCNANLEINAACTKPEQCKSGICTSISGSKKCFNVCSSWADCAGGKICDTKTGACVQAASKINGADCLVQNEVCTSHSCGTDGKCKRCGSASDCVVPGRTTQVGMMCTAGVCQPLREDRQDCMSPTECKSGMCLGTGASRKCGTLCTKNTDCAYLRKICDLTAGACITPKTKATDAACFQNEACQSGLCYNSKCIASCGTATPPPSGEDTTGDGTMNPTERLIYEIEEMIKTMKTRLGRLR